MAKTPVCSACSAGVDQWHDSCRSDEGDVILEQRVVTDAILSTQAGSMGDVKATQLRIGGDNDTSKL